MADYITMFDFSAGPPFGWHVWIMIVTVVIVSVAVPLRFRERGRWRAAAVALVGALTIIGAATFNAATQYLEVARAVRDGHVQIAEGTVSNFVQAQRSHPTETFDLSGLRFACRDWLLSPGCTATHVWGGGLRDGLRLRVTYYDASWNERVITKLEAGGEDRPRADLVSRR